MPRNRNSWKRLAKEGWAFAAIAAIAFVAGLLIGDLGASPKNVTVAVPSMHGAMHEGGGTEEAGGPREEPEPAQGGTASTPGAQIFTSTGCGGCHILAAAGSTGTTGPNLDEFLAPDDTTEAVEEMIVDPGAELAEGYPPNLMPQTYSQSLSKAEVHELAEYLVATTPAKPN